MSKKNIKLSDLQLSVMKILWSHKYVTVSQAHKILNLSKPMALTTVATLLKRLLEKGTINFKKEGRVHVYFPVVSESEVKATMLSSMMSLFFDNKPTEMINHLVTEQDLSDDELKKIGELLKTENQKDKESNHD